MKSKKNILAIIVIFCLVFVVYFVFKKLNQDEILESKTTNNIDTSINTDDGEEDVDWASLEEKDINLTESITITEAGIYNLTGTITGSVTINTSGSVKLILDSVNIKSLNGPALIIEQAENTIIYLQDNTNNVLEDSATYSLDDTDINSVIYSKDDLIIDGNGSLKIISNYQDGIVSKEDLKIMNGSFDIESLDDGIRGKDSVYILNGNFKINSGGDGIKSTNDTDSEKGFILIENGVFKIESELDGFQAETKLIVKNGTFDIKTGGGSTNSSSENDNWGDWGRSQKGGIINPTEFSIDTTSAKGIKAGDNLVIENGIFNLDTSDDSIHSNNYFGLKNGNLNIISGDDGIHADTEIIIDGGIIDIQKSYEGIESTKVTINSGDIQVIASDDGINIAGGNDSSAMNRPGENNYNENSNNILVINNGTIYVNAIGDGIDVNGSAYMYGGSVSVDGPSNSGNGILDYDREFVVNGGTLIATGSSGMLQNVESDKQCNITITLTNSYQANTKVTILNSNDKEIVSYTPSKTFSAIIISSPNLVKGETYKIQIDNNTYQTFTINSYSTIIGSRVNNQLGGNQNHRR